MLVHVEELPAELSGQNFADRTFARCTKSNKCYIALSHLRSDKQSKNMLNVMDAVTSNIHEKRADRRNIAEYMPFLPPLAALVLRLLHRTCLIEIVGEENYRAFK